ncbi:Sfi1 spindle body protein-domain-containing protein [Lasiosphaeria ovina]|uniref:Sfi1 spindle body protein-domain-containing protein n=1 Tax=Lasiosphaeria ovina TaxID=92902 RepID=A0AAE0KB61_9PEZI|nr:Sfi1 spindle body protein-domain-containing protein [Lasiosphaeria ovina]
MLPQSSLPLRDGRVGLPSSEALSVGSQQNEPYYSSQDFQLLHEIVTLGESIYSTLPEQDRLPTNALFQAAEQVLPQYGFDGEHAPSHISRLIFKIGGQRSGETLSDKFQSVVRSMGVQLEYYPSSSVQESPSAKSASSHSFADDDETGRFDFSPRPPPRRRHSSVSHPAEPLSPSNVSDYDLSTGRRVRTRSASSTDYSIAPGGAGNLERRDTGGDNVPGFREEGSHGRRTFFAGLQRPTPTEYRPRRPTHAAGLFGSRQYGADDEGEDSDHATEDLKFRPSQPHLLPANKIRPFLRGSGAVHYGGDDSDHESNKEIGVSPSTAGGTDVVHHSPRSDASGTFRGASDTTAQTQDDQLFLSPPDEHSQADIEALEATLYQFMNKDGAALAKDVLFSWRATARETRRCNDELEDFAVQFDDQDIRSEVFDIWREEAALAKQERLESEAVAAHNEYVERMEKRAHRVYEIFMIRVALLHWQEQALEEVDRTAVARRHLVRKRAFDSWRAQHIQDETKIKNFVLINALQKWGQVALHHEVREQVAIRQYEQHLAKNALQRTWEVYKGRVADGFRDYRLKEDCLNTWSTKAGEAQDEYGVAVALDERLVLDEAFAIWGEETEDLQDRTYDCTVQKLVQDCQRTLSHWREQARLARLLKQYSAGQDNNSKRNVLQVWQSASLAARRDTELANAQFLKPFIVKWRCETNLVRFIDRAEQQTKAAVLEHWALEERLAWYKRHSETQTKRQTLQSVLESSRQARSTRVKSQHEADYVVEYYMQAEALATWLSETEAMERHQRNADLVSLYRTTNPCLGFWRERCKEKVARDVVYRREALRNSRRCTVSNVLDTWPDIAQSARRDRMMRTLRQFRRSYKVNLAQTCLDKWQAAAGDAIASSREACGILVQHKRDDVNDYLDYWIDTAYKAQEIRQIAADAELEVYHRKWHGSLHEARENQHDAVEYDAEKTLAECWKKWEFQSLQMESRRLTVATVREKNGQRLCRQILEEWRQRAVPKAVYSDPRLHLSTMSRRSMRLAQASIPPFRSVQLPSRPAQMTNPKTPHVAASQIGIGRGTGGGGGGGVGGASRSVRFGASSFQLGPMEDFDEESLLPDVEANDPVFMSTPTRWTGSARPLGYRPTTTPSAILPSPYERELRREYLQSARPRVEFPDITEDSAEA